MNTTKTFRKTSLTAAILYLQRSTTGNDYNEEFKRKIMATDPPYMMDEMLDFHFVHFIKKEPGNEELFLDHMEFVIAPLIEGAGNNPHHKILMRWIGRTRKSLTSSQSSVNVNVGNHSIVQLKHNTQSSTQHADISNSYKQFRDLVKQLNQHLPKSCFRFQRNRKKICWPTNNAWNFS